MPTKDEYPYLAFWKVRGFDKFPTIPPEEISKPFKIRGREKARQHLFKKNPILQFLPIEFIKTIDDDLGTHLDKKVNKIVLDRFQAGMEERIYALGLRIFQAQIDHVYGKEPREKILEELGKEFFPVKQGGGLPLTNAHIKSIREVYRELKDLISRAREENDFPKKKTKDFSWETKVDLSLNSPWLNDLCDPDEIKSLCKTSAIADCALEIMMKRLNFWKRVKKP